MLVQVYYELSLADVVVWTVKRHYLWETEVRRTRGQLGIELKFNCSERQSCRVVRCPLRLFDVNWSHTNFRGHLTFRLSPVVSRFASLLSVDTQLVLLRFAIAPDCQNQGVFWTYFDDDLNVVEIKALEAALVVLFFAFPASYKPLWTAAWNCLLFWYFSTSMLMIHSNSLLDCQLLSRVLLWW